jgi:ferredoxin
MAYVIAEPCIGTKDLLRRGMPGGLHPPHPTQDEPGFDDAPQLYIDPEECIDCDACVEACPVDACFAEDQLPEEWQHYIQINADHYKK